MTCDQVWGPADARGQHKSPVVQSDRPRQGSNTQITPSKWRLWIPTPLILLFSTCLWYDKLKPPSWRSWHYCISVQNIDSTWQLRGCRLGPGAEHGYWHMYLIKAKRYVHIWTLKQTNTPQADIRNKQSKKGKLAEEKEAEILQPCPDLTFDPMLKAEHAERRRKASADQKELTDKGEGSAWPWILNFSSVSRQENTDVSSIHLSECQITLAAN